MKPAIIKKLFICGVLASLLYVGTDIFLAMLWKNYSYTSQTISELSAIGAPTRLFWIAMSFLFNPLVIAFGVGVWQSANKRSLRIAGILLSIWGLLGFVWLFFPMHVRGEIGSTTDTMHLVMAGITVPLMMLFIGFGSGAQGKRFRFYSILTIVAMLSFGALTGMQADRVASQLPTPWLGIVERVSVYSPMLWMLALAVVLLQVQNNRVSVVR
jgi:hypothetical protein